MRRPRQRLQVSTFPFLAVLLCTMGCLILLLLVMDKRAKYVSRVRAMQAAEKLARRDQSDLEEERRRREELERRQRELRELLLADEAELRRQREDVERKGGTVGAALDAERAALDDVRRRLERQSSRLVDRKRSLADRRQRVQQLSRLGDATRRELEAMFAQLRDLERTLADLKRVRQRRQQAWSVVPYKGNHGDDRRPIYVECAFHGIVFHPDRATIEGLYVTPFAIREEVERRIARQRDRGAHAVSTLDEVPYVLLLIRPDGIETYYQTLSALAGLRIDFGYEFIERDWELDFPEASKSGVPWRVANGPEAGGGTAGLPGTGVGASGDSAARKPLGSFSTESGPRGYRPTGSGGESIGSPRGNEVNGSGPGASPAGATGVGGGQPGIAQGPAGTVGGSARAEGLGTAAAAGFGRNDEPPPPFPSTNSAGAGSGRFSSTNAGATGNGNSGGPTGSGRPPTTWPNSPGSTAPSRAIGQGQNPSPPGAAGSGTLGSATGPNGNGQPGPTGTGVGGPKSPPSGFRGAPVQGVPGSTVATTSLPGLGAPTASPGGNSPPRGSGAYPPTIGGMGTRAPTVPLTTMNGLEDPLLDGGDPFRSPHEGAAGTGGTGNAGGPPGQPGGSVSRPNTRPGEGARHGAANGDDPASRGSAGNSAHRKDPSTSTSSPAAAGRDGPPGPNRQGTGHDSPGSQGTHGEGQVVRNGSAPPPPEEEEHPTKRKRRGFRSDMTQQPAEEATGGATSGDGGAGGDGLPGGVRSPGDERRPVVRPGWINANRDWFISIECTADSATILATKQRFSLDELARGKSSPLVAAVARLIEKKQATVRKGEPPYRPIVKLLVWPNAMRAYYLAYPSLESLGVSMRRENLDPDYVDPPALWE